MVFTSIPDNYTPINTSLCYQFEFEELREKVDVRVVNISTGHTLAIKRLYDVQYGEIDIAPIVRNSFQYELAEKRSSVRDADGLFAAIAVEIEEVSSPIRYFSPYPIIEGCSTLFRNSHRYQQLSMEDSDYVVLYAPLGGTITCEAYRDGTMVERLKFKVKEVDKVQVFKLFMADFSSNPEEVIVNYELADISDFATYRIVPRPETAHRVVWIDMDGMLQCYTFPTCRQRRLTASKQRVVSSDGVVVTASEVDSVLTLMSDYETIAEMERLSEIIESKQVWVESGLGGVKVDVLSSESVVRYGGALNSLQIEIRQSNREDKLL